MEWLRLYPDDNSCSKIMVFTDTECGRTVIMTPDPMIVIDLAKNVFMCTGGVPEGAD